MQQVALVAPPRRRSRARPPAAPAGPSARADRRTAHLGHPGKPDLGVLRQLAVSGHVPQVHREVGGERLRVRSPQLGRPRGAVAEHHVRANPMHSSERRGRAKRTLPSARAPCCQTRAATGSTAAHLASDHADERARQSAIPLERPASPPASVRASRSSSRTLAWVLVPDQ